MLALSRGRTFLRTGLFQGAGAALGSTAVLLWRGRADGPSAPAMLNASSQWLWGDRALRQPQADMQHTLTGSLIHHGAAALWGLVFEGLQRLHHRPDRRTLVRDAALVTGLAALVDLRLVPPRLSPGFNRHLSRGGLALVYGGFGLGLVLAGGWLLAHRNRP